MPNRLFRAPHGVALEQKLNVNGLLGRPYSPRSGEVISNREAQRRAEALLKYLDCRDPLDLIYADLPRLGIPGHQVAGVASGARLEEQRPEPTLECVPHGVCNDDLATLGPRRRQG